MGGVGSSFLYHFLVNLNQSLLLGKKSFQCLNALGPNCIIAVDIAVCAVSVHLIMVTRYGNCRCIIKELGDRDFKYFRDLF